MGVCWISGIPLSTQAGAALKETIHVSLECVIIGSLHTS